MSHVVRYAPHSGSPVIIEIDESQDPFEAMVVIERNLGLRQKSPTDWDRMLEERRAREVLASEEEAKRRAEREPNRSNGMQARAEGPGRQAVMGEEVLSAPAKASPSGVAETSIVAYRMAKASGKLTAQQQVVANWLRRQIGDATRQEIARGTGLGINAVCGRVNELLAPEVGVLRETRKRKCKVTGETANAVRLA